MSAAIDTSAFDEGGRAWTLRLTERQELRFDVTIDREGGIRITARIWTFPARVGKWLPSRRGVASMSPGELARFGAACLAVADATPSRRRRKARAT